MTATPMLGTALAERIRARVADGVRAVGGVGLTTVLVGDDPASDTYIRLKHRAAVAAGIRATDLRLPASTDQDELLATLGELNADDEVDAVLVQLPLPPHLDETAVIRAVDPQKDVDGFHPLNAGELYLGRPTLVPATARGVLALLVEYQVELRGAEVVVVGRSAIVGKPTAHLLLQADATVTVCHSRTVDLSRHTRAADVLVVAVGRPGVVTAATVKPGSVVIDVGGGDVDADVAEVAGFLTPPRGGVGPMTIACLLENALLCARARDAARTQLG